MHTESILYVTFIDHQCMAFSNADKTALLFSGSIQPVHNGQLLSVLRLGSDSITASSHVHSARSR